MKKAFAIFTAYYRRLGEAVGKFVASVKGEHRLSRRSVAKAETSKDESIGLSVPTAETNASTAEDKFLAARAGAEKSDANSGEKPKHSTLNIEHSTFNEFAATRSSKLETLDQLPTFPVERTVLRKGEPVTPLRSQAPPSVPAFEHRTPIAELRAPNSELPNFITRDELKRELDSLRRLIETRK